MPATIRSFGVVSALGNGADAFWDGLASGRTGIACRRASGCQTERLVAACPRIDLSVSTGDRRARRLGTRTFELLLAASERSCGTDTMPTGSNSGISIAIGSLEQYTDDYYRAAGADVLGESEGTACLRFAERMHYLNPLRRLQYLPSVGAGLLSIANKTTGPAITLVDGVNAGFMAIKLGLDMIANGRVDSVLCGGSDSRLYGSTYCAVSSQYSVSNRSEPENACRPFDVGRTGTVIGEGAAVLKLQACHTLSRQTSEDHVTLVDCQSFHDYKCDQAIGTCLQTAASDSLDLIIANGDGGINSDAAEVTALAKLYRDTGCHAAITSIKAAVGHTVSASASMAVVAACLSVQQQTIFPIRSLSHPIADLPFTNVRQQRPLRHVAVIVSDETGRGGAILVKGRP